MHNTKDRVLLIALRFFLTKPYTEVTMSDILKESGLSKGGFYHHFESKEALYHEVIDRYIIHAFMAEMLNVNNNTPDISIKKFLSAYFRSFVTFIDSRLEEVNLRPEDINLYSSLFDMIKHYKGFNELLNGFHESEITMLKSLIDHAKENNEIKKDIDSLVLAHHFHALMHGISVLSIFEQNRNEVEEMIDKLLANFYALIKV